MPVGWSLDGARSCSTGNPFAEDEIAVETTCLLNSQAVHFLLAQPDLRPGIELPALEPAANCRHKHCRGRPSGYLGLARYRKRLVADVANRV
jgi:hypothetical protein